MYSPIQSFQSIPVDFYVSESNRDLWTIEYGATKR